MTVTPKKVPGWLIVAAAALAGIVAGGIGVYVRLSADGNAPALSANLVAVNCDDAVVKARQLASLANGELAAFKPADRPENFSDLSFKGPDGKDTTLAALGGRVLLVNLWATWCVPCRAEMPALDRLEAARGGPNFAIVPINLDVKGPETARAFLSNIGVTRLPLYADPDMGVFNDLKRRGVTLGLPTTLLVDGKGCRLGVVEGPAAWDSRDAEALIDAALAARAG